jgi:hypothetical protein
MRLPVICQHHSPNADLPSRISALEPVTGDAPWPSRAGAGYRPPRDDRLKALNARFHYRQLGRILFFTFGDPIHHNTLKQLWHQSMIPTPHPPTRGSIAPMPIVPTPGCRSSACTTKAGKVNLSRFMQISRPTVDRWITRLKMVHFDGASCRTHRAQVRPLRAGVHHGLP